jgi:photosystem II stability/assembly factor-like uncharacterized protein
MTFSRRTAAWRGLLIVVMLVGALASAAPAPQCSWAFVRSDRSTAFSQFQFLDAHAGFAHDSQCLWRTDSAGSRWESLWCSDTQQPDWRERGAIDRFEFSGPLSGWLLTRGGALRITRDGGRSWAEQHFPGHLVRAVRFADSLHGWWVGEQPLDGIPDARGVAFHTSDGGEHWRQQSLGVASPVRWRLVDVWPRSAHEAWVLGGDSLLQTSDGGATWNNRSFAELGHWNNDSIRFYPGGIGVIIRSPAQGFLLSVDSGRHWQVRGTPVSAPVLDGLAFVDSRRAWASISGQMYHSADGGHSWRRDTSGPAAATAPRDEPARFHGLQYIDQARLLAVAVGADGFAFCALP